MAYVDEVLADSPVMYWRMDGNPMPDASGNGREGEVGGDLDYSVASLLGGDPNPSTQFNADAAYIYISANAADWMDEGLLADGEAFSIEAIFNADDLTGIRTIAGRWYDSDSSRCRWVLRTNGTNLEFKLRGAYGDNEGQEMSGGYIVCSTPVEAGTTYHAVGTFAGGDGGAVILYLNAVESDSDNQGFYNTNQHFMVGSDGQFNKGFRGRIDEVAYYVGSALSGARVAAHYDAMDDTPALHIAAGLAVETDTPLPAAVDPTVIRAGLAIETDEALSMVLPQHISTGVAIETDVPLHLLGERTPVRFGKVVEREEALEIIPIVQRKASIPQASEHELALPIVPRFRVQTGVGFEQDGHLVVRLGMVTEREQALWIDNSTIAVQTSGPGGNGDDASNPPWVWYGPNGSVVLENTLILDVLEPDLMLAPTSVLVAVSGAIPNRKAIFSIDGVNVFSQLMPDGDGSALFSVPVPEAQGQIGEHVITVDQDGSVAASDIFSLRFAPDLIPTEPGPDTAPVEIPESIHPSGVRRWVLQDLMPGGIGSYVMPLNPQEMDNPSFERVLVSRVTTARDGQAHVSEGGVRPLEWSFKGYCPTREMAETLRAYADLERRFYVIDHRGRAWMFVCTAATIEPRLQQQNIYGDLTDWVHDYTISGVIFDRGEFA